MAEAVADPEVQSLSDAANQTTDAAENQEQDTAEADVSAFLESQGKESGEGGTEAVKSDETDALLEEAREAAAKAAAEKADREARQKAAQEERDRKAQAERAEAQKKFEDGYRDRLKEAGQEAYDMALQAGHSESEAQQARNRAEQRFNSHHADGLKSYEGWAYNTATSALMNAMNEALRQELGTDAPKFFGTDAEPRVHANFVAGLKAFREIVTDGMLTRAEAEADKKLALLKYRKELEKNPAHAAAFGAKSGQQINGSSGGTGPTAPYSQLTTEQRQAMTPAERDAHVARYGA